MKPTLADLEKRFTYHPPKPGQPEQYQRIRAEALAFAKTLVEVSPEGRELSTALTMLEQCTFWANAGIARHG